MVDFARVIQRIITILRSSPASSPALLLVTQTTKLPVMSVSALTVYL